MTAVNDVTLTRILIGTSCVFVACTTPHFLFFVMVPLVPEIIYGGKHNDTLYLVINTTQMSAFI